MLSGAIASWTPSVVDGPTAQRRYNPNANFAGLSTIHGELELPFVPSTAPTIVANKHVLIGLDNEAQGLIVSARIDTNGKLVQSHLAPTTATPRAYLMASRANQLMYSTDGSLHWAAITADGKVTELPGSITAAVGAVRTLNSTVGLPSTDARGRMIAGLDDRLVVVSHDGHEPTIEAQSAPLGTHVKQREAIVAHKNDILVVATDKALMTFRARGSVIEKLDDAPGDFTFPHRRAPLVRSDGAVILIGVDTIHTYRVDDNGRLTKIGSERYEPGIDSPAVFAGERLLIGGHDRSLTAYTIGERTLRQTHKTHFWNGLTLAPQVTRDGVVIASVNDELHALRLTDDGKMQTIDTVKIKTVPKFPSAMTLDGFVVIATGTRLLALRGPQ